MARKLTSCCVALFLMLTAVAAVPWRVNSIADLPNNALTLLYWFAQNVNFYSNGIQLNFNPNTGSYGSHHYRNVEGLLEPLPWGYQYFTIGNHNDNSFPSYVRNEGNRARIIVRVRRENNQLADRIYITRHTATLDSDYDPHETYEVPANVLQQLAQRSLYENEQRAAGYSYQLHGNAPRYVSQAHSFSNQSHPTPAPSSISEDSHFPCLCLSLVVIIILVFFLIIVGNAKV